MFHSFPDPSLVCPPCVCGVPEQTESAVKLRFRTEDDERVKAHRKSLKSWGTREQGRWLGSEDSNLDCMIYSHESIKIDLSPCGLGVDKKCKNGSDLMTQAKKVTKAKRLRKKK